MKYFKAHIIQKYKHDRNSKDHMKQLITLGVVGLK